MTLFLTLMVMLVAIDLLSLAFIIKRDMDIRDADKHSREKEFENGKNV